MHLSCENHAWRCPGMPRRVCTVVPASGSRSRLLTPRLRSELGPGGGWPTGVAPAGRLGLPRPTRYRLRAGRWRCGRLGGGWGHGRRPRSRRAPRPSGRRWRWCALPRWPCAGWPAAARSPPLPQRGRTSAGGTRPAGRRTRRRRPRSRRPRIALGDQRPADRHVDRCQGARQALERGRGQVAEQLERAQQRAIAGLALRPSYSTMGAPASAARRR